jgi:spermidine synthase
MFSKRLPFAVFFLSGLSGLVYQIVWLRLAFAAFGVVTPVISVVLSVFMAGLGGGSLLAAGLLRKIPLSRRAAFLAYAAMEFVIGLGGLAVPVLFSRGGEALLNAGQADSATYLGLSALVILLALLPFCIAMGTTFPFMMQALRPEDGRSQSFSYLYLANVLGALAGTFLAPVVLVEWLGFHGTLLVAACGNWLAAAGGLLLSRLCPPPSPAIDAQDISSALPDAVPSTAAFSSLSRRSIYLILFWTGLCSMGMEVVWTRAFAPVLRTQVYSFSGLLFTYLLSTWLGSVVYRVDRRKQRLFSPELLTVALSVAAFCQMLANDPRILRLMDVHWIFHIAWTLGAIVPYCVLLGYLTPRLIDDDSGGDPALAGRAYAVNVAGCILGPLLASYILLPKWGILGAGIVFALPIWLLAGRFAFRRPAGSGRSTGADRSTGSGRSRMGMLLGWTLATVAGLALCIDGASYEELRQREDFRVFRDHTATVVASAYGDTHPPELIVNGMGITTLTTTTKLMAHLPLALLSEPPESALNICFGMGTTFRSLLTWNIDVTAVELVPGVKTAFPLFHADAETLLKQPQAHIVIDDGRRFVRRTEKLSSVVTIDPPPPVEAAGSSLLYSRDFYTELKRRLAPHGILQQWFPSGDRQSFEAVLRAVVDSFPHVRTYRGLGGFGCHILASMEPIPERTAAELRARMPEAALRDLEEWDSEDSLELVLKAEMPVKSLLNPDPTVVITDDRPYNEYYLLRRLPDLLRGKSDEVWGPGPAAEH